MARLITLAEVLASVLDSDDDSDNFSHLNIESEEEEDGVSAYTGQQQFGLEKLAALSQVVSTEPLASSSSSKLCSSPEEQFLDSAGALEQQKDFTGKVNRYKSIIMHEKNGNSRAIISRVLGG